MASFVGASTSEVERVDSYSWPGAVAAQLCYRNRRPRGCSELSAHCSLDTANEVILGASVGVH